MRIESGSIGYDPTEDNSTRKHHVVKILLAPSIEVVETDSFRLIHSQQDAIRAAESYNAFAQNQGRPGVAIPGHLERLEDYHRTLKPGETPDRIIRGIPIKEDIHELGDGQEHLKLVK